MFAIKKLIIIKKICNDNDNEYENDNLSSISIEVNKTVFVLYIYFLWKNSKHLKHKQKHFK